jgi:hypothetical protein
LFNQLSDLFKLLAAKAIRLRQHNRIHPEFGIVLGILNVNVDWFLRFTAEKEGGFTSHSLLTFFLHRTKDRDASTVTN